MMRYLFALLIAFMPLTAVVAQNPEYKLVWSDEFDYEGLPDTTKWTLLSMRPRTVNNEEQEYVPDIRNAWVADGKLHIRAIKEGDRITSARMVTRGKGDWKYCKVQVRAKLPSGKGIWPAIWMMPSRSVYGNWPASGEIDIMEFVGYQPDTIHVTVHTKKFNHKIGTQVGTLFPVEGCSDGYHIYGCEWTEKGIDFYVDDVLRFTFPNDGSGDPDSWPFDIPYHIILNVAFGGDWGGAKGVDYDILPGEMLVDYVRVYQK